MIFHKYQLIFTGITKNASTSVHMMLRNPTDHEHNHKTLMDDYNSNDSELMDHYNNLAIVRNPYDRFILACWQIRRDDFDVRKEWDINYIFKEEVIDAPVLYNHINEVFIPQHKFICFGRKILVDHLLKYETLDEDWIKFAEEYNKESKFKIPARLPQFNQSNDRLPWQEEIKQFSQENLDLFNKRYHLDFEIFGYKKIDKVPK